MGESAMVLGEVRGNEARTLYESMRTGRAGSSIMGTIHGDSFKTVYDRVVHDMNIAPEEFMATEVLVTLGTVKDRKTNTEVRKVNELVATGDRTGEFIDISAAVDFSTPVMRRALSTSGLTMREAMQEIEARGEIRNILAEKGNENQDYLSPEWINLANEYITRNSGKDCETIVNGFRSKLSAP